jgi:hypothetical protein
MISPRKRRRIAPFAVAAILAAALLSSEAIFASQGPGGVPARQVRSPNASWLLSFMAHRRSPPAPHLSAPCEDVEPVEGC